MNKPYIFYFDTPYGLVEFPITPGELTITNDSNNKTVTLINEGDVNILKSPALIEVEFEARFPTHKYPYSSEPKPIVDYMDIFTKLKENKKPFKFMVARSGYAEKSTGTTNLTVALESLETNESADEGDDVIYTFKLKQYKEYKVIQLPDSYKTKLASNDQRGNSGNAPGSETSTYTVQSGDCLWTIAKQFYGDGTKWTLIYDANKSVIEETANKYRNGKGSSNGHWIYPGTVLTIPGVSTGSSSSSTSSSSGSSSSSSGGSSSSSSSSSSTSDFYRVDINFYGTTQAIGTMKVVYMSRGKQLSVTLSKNTPKHSANADKNSSVRVYVTPTTNGTFSETLTGSWKRTYSSDNTTCFTIDKLTKNSSIVINFKSNYTGSSSSGAMAASPTIYIRNTVGSNNYTSYINTATITYTPPNGTSTVTVTLPRSNYSVQFKKGYYVKIQYTLKDNTVMIVDSVTTGGASKEISKYGKLYFENTNYDIYVNLHFATGS